MRLKPTSYELLKQLLRVIPEDDACMEWPRTRNADGYGTVYVTRDNGTGAHRAAYELTHGAITDASAKVCHRCDNPPCFRPDHLFLGTDLENARDSAAKDRRNHPRGTRNPKAKLTEAQVLAIRAALESDDSYGRNKAIAAEFSIGRLLVHRIKTRKYWSHI